MITKVEETPDGSDALAVEREVARGSGVEGCEQRVLPTETPGPPLRWAASMQLLDGASLTGGVLQTGHETRGEGDCLQWRVGATG